MPDDDKRFSPQCRHGILEAFVRHHKALRRFISRHMVPISDIDDISQEAFLRAYQAERKKPIEQPKAFLFRIAKNLMLSESGKKSRRITDYIEDFEYTEILAEGENLEDNIMAQQKLGIYCEAVATLTPQCRRAFLLKKVYGMTHKEIASHMGIAVSTVEKHLVKGVRQCDTVIAERYNDLSAPAGTRPQGKSAGQGIKER